MKPIAFSYAVTCYVRYAVEATVPPEVVAEAKKPVSFGLVMTMPFEDYSASKDAYDAQLIAELSSAVTIPQELVHIKFSEAGRGGVVFGISFYMEPRCLQNLGNEVELLSFGINTKEGCNLVAPVEYMNELQVQLSDSKSALFYRSDLDLLLKVGGRMVPSIICFMILLQLRFNHYNGLESKPCLNATSSQNARKLRQLCSSKPTMTCDGIWAQNLDIYCKHFVFVMDVWHLGFLAFICLAECVVGVSDSKTPEYFELYFDQALDHFDASSRQSWPERYLLQNASWDGRMKGLPEGCKGPILLYAGNEGSIEDFWDGNGFMIDVLAPRWGGLLVFPEQRFYGRSLPCGNASLEPDCLRYLSTAQVLEDYVELVRVLRAELPGAANCPVIAFGGSYGGTLAALLRATRPAVFAGALAASSELGYYDLKSWAGHGVDGFAFEDVVLQTFSQQPDGSHDCIAAITDAQDSIKSWLHGANGENPGRLSALSTAFGVCAANALGSAEDRAALFTYALEGLPQQDYPYAIGPLPGHPVRAVCQQLVHARAFGEKTEGIAGFEGMPSLVKAAAAVTRLAMGFANSSSCIPEQGPGGPGNTPGDGPGPDAWGWQSCTEALHSFSARGLRNYTFDYQTSEALCAKIWNHTAVLDTGLIASRFGGFDLADGSSGVQRIIWSHGTLDPWHGWFRKMKEPPSVSQIYHILMRDAAHHLDLKTPNLSDPPDVTRARAREMAIIEGWILEAGQASIDEHFLI
ncbi:unnamed protein product [Polarella glacialis]|uniref:Lysosomal Pro-Xaa carboxypeptidase n=1 Tax=Polarella glacialis TaxID=89957 RepID=A0A813I0E4_POLGL|nr:unnamed protein product [Polarella glacialis]